MSSSLAALDVLGCLQWAALVTDAIFEGTPLQTASLLPEEIRKVLFFLERHGRYRVLISFQHHAFLSCYSIIL
jgi:hypothetical protein